jgi:hypothetical protein
MAAQAEQRLITGDRIRAGVKTGSEGGKLGAESEPNDYQ